MYEFLIDFRILQKNAVNESTSEQMHGDSKALYIFSGKTFMDWREYCHTRLWS